MGPVRRLACLALALLVDVAGGADSLAGQSGGVELGIDVAAQVSLPDDGDALTTVEMPLGRVRAGVYAGGGRWLLETGLGFALASQSGRTASAGRADAALALHFGASEARMRPFVLIGGGGRFARSDGRTVGQALTLGGIGLKTRFEGSLGLRLEVDYARAFGTMDLAASHEIRGLVGLSFFTGS